MKIDIEEVEAKLLELKFDRNKVQEVVRELEAVAEEIKEDRKQNSAPKSKWEHIIVISDPEGKITDEFTGWVIQQPDGEDAGQVLSKLMDAANAQNETAKRKKNVLSTPADIFGGLKSKYLQKKLRIKTKEPVRVLTVGKTF